jgi:hypothetical protein
MLGFEHLHSGFDFSILDQFVTWEPDHEPMVEGDLDAECVS